MWPKLFCPTNHNVIMRSLDPCGMLSFAIRSKVLDNRYGTFDQIAPLLLIPKSNSSTTTTNQFPSLEQQPLTNMVYLN